MPRFAVSFLAVAILSALTLGRVRADVPAEEAVPLATYLTIADQPDKLLDHWSRDLPPGPARHAMDQAVRDIFPPSTPLFVDSKHQDEDEGNPPPNVIIKVHPRDEMLLREHIDVVAAPPSALPYVVGIGVAGAVLGIGLLVQFLRRG